MECPLPEEVEMPRFLVADSGCRSGFSFPHEQQDSTAATTMMLRNIPCRLTRDEVLQQFYIHGFRGCFDFFSMPESTGRTKRAAGTSTSLCYGFINFLCAEDAWRFQAFFHGRTLTGLSPDMACEVEVSRKQGLQTNLHFQASRPAGKHKQRSFVPIYPVGEPSSVEIDDQNTPVYWLQKSLERTDSGSTSSVANSSVSYSRGHRRRMHAVAGSTTMPDATTPNESSSCCGVLSAQGIRAH
ncbi:unnamed protein product [Polarella glacialis]|uniref:Mei2-like C-terminal RNA recognition motif domain-containing protein n=1 Tax=Polarella glacialis TaxID=89957 RepID=A0A813LWS3_POLGL|nr:unnamed protein product [Polarella glacialis]